MATPFADLRDYSAGMEEFYPQLSGNGQAIDAMLNGTIALDISSGSRLLTEDEARAASEYRLTGTPSAAVTLTLPATIARASITIVNGSGQDVTIGYATGPTVTIADGSSKVITADKTDVRERGAGLGGSLLEIRADGVTIAATASFLDFRGDVTVAKDPTTPSGVRLTIAGANGLTTLVDDGEVIDPPAPALQYNFNGKVFSVTPNENAGVDITLTDLLVDEEGNPVGFASNLPVFENANLRTESAEALNFVGFRTTVSQSGTVNIFAEGLTVRTFDANGFLGASAANAMVRSTAATAITLTIEDAQSAGFEPGTLIGGVVVGDGVVTIEGAGGVSLNGLAAGAAVVGGAGTHFSLVMLAQDDWWLAVGEVPA